jgi:glycosyltransferase involved in cell wall biosynthesis
MDYTFCNLEALIKEAGLSLPVISPQKKRRFLLVGTHAHQTTGYSKVTYNIIQELAKLGTLELFHFGFQKFVSPPPDYRPYPSGVEVYDPVELERSKTAEQEMGFGFSQLPEYIRKIKPDVVLIYNDAGVICRFLDKLSEKLPEAERKQYKLIIYLDQVYTIQRPELLGRIEKDADAYFAFTEYWKQMLEKQGVKKPIYVLRHGFDKDQFVIKNRTEMRKKHGIPENMFIFLNLNRNTPRKRYDIVVTAFAELVARHPTKSIGLLAVCDGGESGGFPIQEIFLRELDRLGVPLQFHAQKLMITKSALTYTDELINELYSLSDVGITGADGEGFGLCQFEAMGVGIPQVVPFIGGFRDFCVHGTNCQAVPPKYRAYMALGQSSVGGMAEIVDPHDLMLAAEEYLMDSELRETHGKRARETVLQYSWDKEVAGLERIILTI